MAVEPTEYADRMAGPVSGSTRSTPFLPDNLDTEFEALLAGLERANPQPKPLSRTQDIGAGLMRIGNALRGGDPSIQSGPERQRAQQEENYQAGQRETNRLRISDAYRRREIAASEKREAERAASAATLQAQRDAEIAERQRIDDERAAQKADREKGMALIDGLVDKPGFVLPDQESLKTMTHAKAQSIAQAYWQGRGVEPAAANFAVWLKETQAQMPGGTELGSATLPVPGGGQATFKKPEPIQPIPAERPVSTSTMARGDKLGLKFSGKESEIEASNLIAEAQEAERDKRFGKVTPRGNKTYDEMVLLMQIEAAANKALAYGAQYGGPVQGSALSTPYLAIKDWKDGTDELARKYQYNGFLADVATSVRKAQSGAAVTPQEGTWMAPLIPSAMDLDTKREQNLRRLADRAREAYLGRAQFAKLTDEDLGIIRQRMFGALPPLPTQPGDIAIGDSY